MQGLRNIWTPFEFQLERIKWDQITSQPPHQSTLSAHPHSFGVTAVTLFPSPSPLSCSCHGQRLRILPAAYVHPGLHRRATLQSMSSRLHLQVSLFRCHKWTSLQVFLPTEAREGCRRPWNYYDDPEAEGHGRFGRWTGEIRNGDVKYCREAGWLLGDGHEPSDDDREGLLGRWSITLRHSSKHEVESVQFQAMQAYTEINSWVCTVHMVASPSA